MRIVNWNIERRKPSSWQARSLVDEIASLEPDYVCLTEAWKQSLADFGGHVISAEGGAWSPQHPDERKVVLWSRNPWADVEPIEQLEAIGSAITARSDINGNVVRFVGVCIPYHFASPLGVEPRAKPWTEHERFLEILKPHLARWARDEPVTVLGDFNRRVPRSWGPKQSYEKLEDTFSGYQFATTGILDEINDRTIDHIAFAGSFEVKRVYGKSAHLPDGRRRSDHFGVVAELA